MLPLVPGHALFGEFRKGNRLPGAIFQSSWIAAVW